MFIYIILHSDSTIFRVNIISECVRIDFHLAKNKNPKRTPKTYVSENYRIFCV